MKKLPENRRIVSIPHMDHMDPLGVMSYRLIMPFIQIVTPFITGRGPPCWFILRFVDRFVSPWNQGGIFSDIVSAVHFSQQLTFRGTFTSCYCDPEV